MAEKVQKGVFIIVLALVISVRPVVTSSADHRYSVGDNVPLYANKVGPLNNPSETYEYFDFPFCLPDQVIRKKESLGEVLNGDRFTNSMYELKFREDKTNEDLCKKTLTREEVAKFRDSVRNEFYFQMYYDNLPLWGFIGKVEDPWILNATGPRYYLFKHVNFDILFNKDRVIEIYAFNDPNHAVDISEDNETNIQFTYSVFWKATSAEFEKRMQRYSKSSLLPKHFQIHWFSIINSIAIIVLLVGLFSTLFLRTLKNDLKKCSNEDEDEDTEKEELSWKNLHGDVFRFPPHTSLFCAILATGTQILTMISFVFVLSFLGVLYPFNRGALYTFIVAIYAATSVLAGYNAASFRAKLAGPRQAVAKTVLLTGVLYFGPLFLTFSVLNTIAISYGATAALPFGTIVVIILIWTLATIPLLTLGGIVGYAFRNDFHAPCDARRLPLEIPPLVWYRRSPTQIFLGGLLPFSAIIIELHYMCRSLWGHKMYTIYSILFIMFVILVILTAILSIGLTYFQLSVEDHKWWWRSVLNGGSTSIFMYAYFIIFYAQSSMSGLLQRSFYFGYNACICYAFFLMLGTISFRASLLFVRQIYRNVKLE